MPQHEWTIDQDVREDAESVFVPAENMQGADVGDVVRFRSEYVGVRFGHVTALTADDARGTFFTVQLDRPDPP